MSDEVVEAARELVLVIHRCLSTRGWLSCAQPHDVRCPKFGRADARECACGADQFFVVLGRLEAACSDDD